MEKSQEISRLRALFIVLVVFLHSYQEQINLATGSVQNTNEIVNFIKLFFSGGVASVAVPGLFVISGYLVFKKPFNYKENAIKKIKSLVIPYLIMNTVWILFFCVATRLPYVNVFFTSDELNVWSWDILKWLDAYGGLDGKPLLYPMWFLRDLFLMNLLAPLFLITNKRLPQVMIVIYGLSWMFVEKLPYIHIDIRAFVFFGVGSWLAINSVSMSKTNNKIKYEIRVIVVIVYFLALFINQVVGSDAYWINRTLIIVGLIVSWFIVCFLQNKRNALIDKISKWGMIIYLFHEFTMSICQKILAYLFPSTPVVDMCKYFLLPLFIVGLCIIVGMMIKRISPKTYAVLTGGRS